MFARNRLVAQLGIVDCGQGIARYQHVFTAPEHRRRGLTSHLLGVAARWASDRGCNRWVIVADADSDASRLYQACGFTDAEGSPRPIGTDSLRSSNTHRSGDRSPAGTRAMLQAMDGLQLGLRYERGCVDWCDQALSDLDRLIQPER